MLDAKDLLLYLCTDRLLSMGRPLTEAVEAAISGGVTMVQLREKDACTKEFYEIALAVKSVTDRHGIPLVINDRVDIALAIGAQGIHLGQSDMPLTAARKLVGNSMFIGISASTPEEALEAQKNGADYIGAGAIFPTGSKADISDIGLDGLRAVAQAVNIPVVGIGGIGISNAASVIGAGACGVAVISAILSQPDIAGAAKALRSRIE